MSCLLNPYFPHGGHREDAHTGKGMVHHWMGQQQRGLHESIFEFGTVLQSTFWHLPLSPFSLYQGLKREPCASQPSH